MFEVFQVGAGFFRDQGEGVADRLAGEVLWDIGVDEVVLYALEGRDEVDWKLLVYLGGASFEDYGEVVNPVEVCAEWVAELVLEGHFLLPMLDICAGGVHVCDSSIGTDVYSALGWEFGVVGAVPEEFENGKAGQAGDGEQDALGVMHAARDRRPRVAFGWYRGSDGECAVMLKCTRVKSFRAHARGECRRFLACEKESL